MLSTSLYLLHTQRFNLQPFHRLNLKKKNQKIVISNECVRSKIECEFKKNLLAFMGGIILCALGSDESSSARSAHAPNSKFDLAKREYHDINNVVWGQIRPPAPASCDCS